MPIVSYSLWVSFPLSPPLSTLDMTLEEKRPQVRIEASWYQALLDEFASPYFEHLTHQIRQAYQTTQVYPRASYIFRALDLCPLSQIRVVILGQDPYHEEGQAEGLAFSVPPGIIVPPSLRNIKAEIASDLGSPSIIQDGHLMPWVQQGVLLLNATLTVEAHKAGSHQGWGWETLTDAIIRVISQKEDSIVFMLWGSYAQRKGAMINSHKHLILKAPHPSPLSAHRGFFGCKHFSQANAFLTSHGKSPIVW